MKLEGFVSTPSAVLQASDSDRSTEKAFIGLKKLLLVSTTSETFATILCYQPRYLTKFFDVGLVSSSGAMTEQVEKAEGLAIQCVPMKRGISVLNDLKSVFQMVRVLRRVRPAIVHSYTPKAGLIAMLAGFLCRVPIRVHTFTGLIFPTSTGLRRHLLLWIDRLICACATNVVPEGLGVQRDLEEFGVTRKSLEVIGHGNIAGVDTSFFSPHALGVEAAGNELRVTFGVSESDFVFCFVGRLNKDKGLLELMEAFLGLPSSAHLFLAGDLDESAPVPVEVLTKMRQHPRIHFLGFLLDIRPVLSAASALVLPSYREGFPNVVLQAGAMSVPVIASNINGCNEVIEPGSNGLLVAPRDASALGTAMRELLHLDPLAIEQMGHFGRVRIQERFERRDHWLRMVKFYKSILLSKKLK